MIDLETIAANVGLPQESMSALLLRAAVALERRHSPGVHLTGRVDQQAFDEELQWRALTPQLREYEDANRVTEEGAEAIALALCGSKSSWRVIRRMQSRKAEGADWLLLDPSSGTKVVLEVGGTDEGDLDSLLQRKIKQAKASPFAAKSRPAACVVRFVEPSALMWSNDEPR